MNGFCQRRAQVLSETFACPYPSRRLWFRIRRRFENICKVADVGKSFEIAQNDFFVDVLIVVVPRRVACKMVNPTRAFLRILGKIRVENAVVSAVYVHKVKQFVFAVNRQALNVFCTANTFSFISA